MSFFDIVFNEHSLGVSLDEFRRRMAKLVRHEQGGFFVPEIGDRDLANWTVIYP